MFFKCLLISRKIITLLDELDKSLITWRREKKPILILIYEKLQQVQVHSSQSLKIFEYRMWMGHINISKMVKYDMDCK